MDTIVDAHILVRGGITGECGNVDTIPAYGDSLSVGTRLETAPVEVDRIRGAIGDAVEGVKGTAIPAAAQDIDQHIVVIKCAGSAVVEVEAPHLRCATILPDVISHDLNAIVESTVGIVGDIDDHFDFNPLIVDDRGRS